MPSLPFDESGSFSPPPAFGPYRVLHQIGSGVLGPVFRTYDSHNDRLVAVKVFRLDLLPEQVATLAEQLRRLAGTAGIISAGLEGTTAYLATDYLTAETLDVALRHLAPAPLEVALPILTQLADRIDDAWQAGPQFGHGALHPRDIFIAPDTHEVNVTGFGVTPALEATGARGTIRRPYTAPERAAGDAWDERADVYSLAAIAHELLTGRRPAGAGQQDGSLPASMPAEMRVHVRRVLSKALAESPAQRFATASEFVHALADPASLPEPAPPLTPGAPALEPPPVIAPPIGDTPLVTDARDEFDPGPAQRAGQTPLSVSGPAAPLETASGASASAAAGAAAGTGALKSTRASAAASASRSREMPVAPRLSANLPLRVDEPEPGAVFEPELLRTTPPAPAFTLPPPFPWAALAAAAIAGLVIGAVGMHQWDGHRAPAASTVPADATRSASAPAPPASAPAPPTSPPPSAPSSADTEVKVTEPPAAPAAPAPTRPAPLPGRLAVRSTPSGAAVSVDGRAVGRTPLAAHEIAFGTHTVVVSKPGFVSASRRVTASRRSPRASLVVTLRAEPAPARAGAAATTGSISVDSRPRGARVTIDGKLVGVTPMSAPGLSPGAHALRLELDGYKPLSTTVQVKAGETARIAVTLEVR